MSKSKDGIAESLLRKRGNPAEAFLSRPEAPKEQQVVPVKEVRMPEPAPAAEIVQRSAGAEDSAQDLRVTRVKENFPTKAGKGYYNVSGVVGNHVETKSKPVNYILRPSTLELLRARAKMQGISCNELLHFLIETYCVD